jgi:acyl-coenzyme A synthetase/AMP-(fatty) acid ligase
MAALVKTCGMIKPHRIDARNLLATAGTTGVPKFVIHTQSTLTALGSACEHFGPDQNHIAIVARPTVHCSRLYTAFWERPRMRSGDSARAFRS